MEKDIYSIGIDYGTRSARALLVNITSGAELGYIECKYPHDIIETELPTGEKLKEDYALQHPDDYLYVLKNTIPNLIKKFNINPNNIVGIGIDFTACTVLPIKEDGTPLCLLDEFKHNPHSFVKLWKHHAAQYCADIINKQAKKTNQPWLKRNGGKISSEFYFPKLLQIKLEAPEIFNNTDLFIEAGDYIVYKLTGNLVRSACMAGYKALWTENLGYPTKDFLNSLDKDFGNKALNMLKGKIKPTGSKAGNLTKKAAKFLGLSEKTVVTTAIIDAHAAIPAAGITKEDEMLMILGTSGCHISLSKIYKEVDGICGIVKDGIIEGFYAYEAGQAGMGDHFEWMLRTIVNKQIEEKAKNKGLSVLEYLSLLAQKQAVGAHGLLALDWWNGNRTVLNDSDLSGVILGLNLSTKPEDIYRALVEAVAYGTRKIIENYENNGINVNTLYATGSMAKSTFVMQTFSDVLGKEIKIAASKNGGCLGSAIFAAAAAEVTTLKEATLKLGKIENNSFKPNENNKVIYDKLYYEYDKLYDYFGKGENSVLKTLKKIKSANN